LEFLWGIKATDEGCRPKGLNPGRSTGIVWGDSFGTLLGRHQEAFRGPETLNEFPVPLSNAPNPNHEFRRLVELGTLNQYDHGRNIEANRGFISTSFRRMVELGVLNQYDHGRNIERNRGFISTGFRAGTLDYAPFSECYGPTFDEENLDKHQKPLLTNGYCSPAFEPLSRQRNEVIPILVSGISDEGLMSQVSCPPILTNIYEAVTTTFPKPRITSEFVISPIPRATKSAFSHGGDPWEADEDEQHERGGADFAQGRPGTAFTNLCNSYWANPLCSAWFPELTALCLTEVHRDLAPTRETDVHCDNDNFIVVTTRVSDVHRDSEATRMSQGRNGEGFLGPTEGVSKVDHSEAALQDRGEQLPDSSFIQCIGHQALPRPDTQVSKFIRLGKGCESGRSLPATDCDRETTSKSQESHPFGGLDGHSPP
jgi:hypothetical protein